MFRLFPAVIFSMIYCTCRGALLLLAIGYSGCYSFGQVPRRKQAMEWVQ